MTDYQLNGVITDALTNAGVPGVPVRLFAKNQQSQMWNEIGDPANPAKTDELGKYTLKAPTNGSYKIQPDQDYTSFDPEYLSITVNGNKSDLDFSATIIHVREQAFPHQDLLFAKTLLSACRESVDGWVVEKGEADAIQYVADVFKYLLSERCEICIPLPYLDERMKFEEKIEIIESWRKEQQEILQRDAYELLRGSVHELASSCNVCKQNYLHNGNYAAYVSCMTKPTACTLP